MRKLGMQPVLQGYSGMVPVDITSKDPSAEVIKQGTWCSFQRPSMLRTDSESFTKYAALFYKKYRKKFMEIPLIIMQQTRSMKVEIPVVWIPLLFRRKSLQA